MKNLNEVHLIGSIITDVELKKSSKGSSWLSFAMVTNYYKKLPEGGLKALPTYHNLAAFGKVAEDLANNTRKGKHIDLLGSLTNQKYTDKSGTERYAVKIVVNSFSLVEENKEKPNPDAAQVPKDGDDLPF